MESRSDVDFILQNWPILTAVQAIFAYRGLPWYESMLEKFESSDADHASIDNFRTFYRVEVSMMLSYIQPDLVLARLPASEIKDLKEELILVLNIFEHQVRTKVFDIALATEENDKVIEKRKKKYSLLFRYRLVPKFTRFLVNNQQSNSNIKELFPKLKRLMRLLENSRNTTDTVLGPMQDNGYLLNLGSSRSEYTKALNGLQRFNSFLQSLDNSLSTESSTIQPSTNGINIAVTQAQEISRQLFGSLVRTPFKCGKPHTALLHMTGFKDESSDYYQPVYDMFVSCCPMLTEWHETHCTMPITIDPTNSTKLSEMCDTIQNHRQLQKPLVLMLGRNQLFTVHETPEEFIYENSDCQMSLEQLLNGGHFKSLNDGGSFTIGSKKLLILNLARCLLNLYGSEWLQEEWDASRIIFLCGADSDYLVDMHRPYVPSTLSSLVPLRTVQDNLIPYHPAILSFAKILLEIERGKKILENEYQVMKSTGQISQWLTVSAIYSQQKRGSLTEHYQKAITSCLHFAKTGSRMVNESSYIEHNIVKPLEQDAAPYLGGIKFENMKLELFSGRFHVATLGESVSTTTSLLARQLPTISLTSPIKMDPGILPAFDGTNAVMFDDRNETFDANSLVPFRARNFLFGIDMWVKERHKNLTAIQTANNTVPTESSRPKIAILDTGIDESNPKIRGLRMRHLQDYQRHNSIKVVKSFISDDGLDRDGHGTLTSYLLLSVAPRADIYVAKIATSKTFDQCDCVADAIDEAVKEWNVDIIVMPFGIKEVHEKTKAAINDAYYKGKILIASASNGGGNEDRAYPAKDERVICIHATDGSGNDNGGINPSPVDRGDNFTTLGLGIEFFWSGKEIFKSGTSYSAPIAAGIAANILDFTTIMALDGTLPPEYQTRIREGEGMKKVFRLMAESRQGYDYIAPWNLWRQGLNEGDVCSSIKRVL
ncbi:hypothetical protein F4806DRAFT_482812, partial [Annulohypoxylon nitens]